MTAPALPAKVVSGTIAANGASVVAGLVGMTTLGIQISGTWSGTIAFQFSRDGSTQQSGLLLPDAGGAAVLNTTANGGWCGNVSAFVFFQAIATAWSSGTATITIAPSTSILQRGVWVPYSYLSLASTNLTALKTIPGTLGAYQIYNTNATNCRYVKIYDKASAPVPGTDTPILRLPVPAALSSSQPSGISLNKTDGIEFVNGIAFGITGALADNDTTAIGANDVVMNLLYN